MNIHIHIFLCEYMLSVLSDIYLVVGFLGQMESLCLKFWRTAQLFSKEGAPFCIPTCALPMGTVPAMVPPMALPTESLFLFCKTTTCLQAKGSTRLFSTCRLSWVQMHSSFQPSVLPYPQQQRLCWYSISKYCVFCLCHEDTCQETKWSSTDISLKYPIPRSYGTSVVNFPGNFHTCCSS